MKFNSETETIFNGQIDPKLIALITEKVAEKLVHIKKNIVVFSGSTSGFHKTLEELKKIKDENYDFCVYMTDQAERVLDRQRIQECLHQKDFFYTSEIQAEQLCEDANVIILPDLTINMAAKIASCIADTPELELIQQALLKGTRVLAAIDGCCPDCIKRYQRDSKLSDSMYEQLKTNLEKIQSFGICLVPAKGLCEAVLQRPAESDVVKLDQKVICQTDIDDNKAFPVIKIKENALVTQLAEEAAKAYGIRIIRE